MVKAECIIAAYEDCRKGKASSPDAIRFETYLFENITDLVERINSRTYEPMPSITFVVSRPVYREVFAANFRDRVIHHYIALRLEPLFKGVFSDRTYNCRCGKGQLYGVRQLAADIVEWSWYTTKDMVDSCFTAMVVTTIFYLYSFARMFVNDTKLGRKICA